MIDHAQAALGGLQQRDVQRSAAQVEHQPGPVSVVALVGAPAGRDRAGDRLLDQDDLLEPRQAPGPRRRVVLRQLEQRGRRDHRRARLEPGRVAHVGEQRRDHRGGQLLGQQRRAGRLERQPLAPSPSAVSTPPRVFAGSPSRPRTARRPTVRPPRASSRTTDGVSVSPAALATTVTASPSYKAIAELLVPRSMPTWMPDPMCLPGGSARSPPVCL